MNSKNIVLSTAYLPSIQYYCKLISYHSTTIDVFEYFEKQTYRNRCIIYSANGELALSVPVQKLINPKTIVKDIKISYDTDWQKIHFKAIESAYRSSPFYEYYIDDLMPLFNQKYHFLVDINNHANNVLFKLIGINPALCFSENYIDSQNINDFRNAIHPKKQCQLIDPEFKPIQYNQVFASKYGFKNNLSIIDALFNIGPETKKYLHKCC